MRPSTLTLNLLILLCPNILFANTDIRGMWTNGWEEFAAMRMNDSMWHFEGDYLHEGGLAFDLKPAGDSSFVIMTAEDHLQPSVGKPGDKVVYRTVDGHRVLIVYTKKGAIEEIFTVMEPGRKLEDIVCEAKTAYELSGKYKDEQSGREVVFYPTRPEASGLLSASDVYYFETDHDVPANVITFKNNVHFWYEKTDSSLQLYELKGDPNDEDSWEKGRKLHTLKQTGWMDQTRGKQSGRYGFASTIILTRMTLSYFSTEARRIMRNEIYARHGYVFKSPDLQAYFAAQPWYKPIDGAGEAQLTELEKLNARIIADHPAPQQP